VEHRIVPERDAVVVQQRAGMCIQRTAWRLFATMGMKLRDARLCLDCEELHTEEQCPVCASEAFSFVTRWIPSHNGKQPVFAELRRATGGPVVRDLLATR